MASASFYLGSNGLKIRQGHDLAVPLLFLGSFPRGDIPRALLFANRRTTVRFVLRSSATSRTVYIQ